MTSRIAVVLALILAACTPPGHNGNGNGNGNPDGGMNTSGPPTVDNFLSQFTTAVCAIEVRCNLLPDTSICEALVSQGFTTDTFNSEAASIAAAKAGKTTFSATQATACLNAVNSVGCAALQGNEPSACLNIFSGGTVAPGGACIADTECTTGNACVASTMTNVCAGTCTAISATNCRADSDCATGMYCDGTACQTVVAAGGSGAPCGVPTQCQTGFFCDNSQNPAVCAAEQPSGSMCSPGAGGCATGLACVVADDGMSATCLTPATLGQACTSLFQCGAQYEINDIICDETSTHKCVAMPSTGACVVVQGAFTCNPATAFCNPPSTGTTGTCTAYLTAGATCNPMLAVSQCGISGQCTPSSTGTTGTCTAQTQPICTP